MRGLSAARNGSAGLPEYGALLSARAKTPDSVIVVPVVPVIGTILREKLSEFKLTLTGYRQNRVFPRSIGLIHF